MRESFLFSRERTGAHKRAEGLVKNKTLFKLLRQRINQLEKEGLFLEAITVCDEAYKKSLVTSDQVSENFYQIIISKIIINNENLPHHYYIEKQVSLLKEYLNIDEEVELKNRIKKLINYLNNHENRIVSQSIFSLSYTVDEKEQKIIDLLRIEIKEINEKSTLSVLSRPLYQALGFLFEMNVIGFSPFQSLNELMKADVYIREVFFVNYWECLESDEDFLDDSKALCVMENIKKDFKDLIDSVSGPTVVFDKTILELEQNFFFLLALTRHHTNNKTDNEAVVVYLSKVHLLSGANFFKLMRNSLKCLATLSWPTIDQFLKVGFTNYTQIYMMLAFKSKTLTLLRNPATTKKQRQEIFYGCMKLLNTIKITRAVTVNPSEVELINYIKLSADLYHKHQSIRLYSHCKKIVNYLKKQMEENNQDDYCSKQINLSYAALFFNFNSVNKVIQKIQDDLPSETKAIDNQKDEEKEGQIPVKNTV